MPMWCPVSACSRLTLLGRHSRSEALTVQHGIRKKQAACALHVDWTMRSLDAPAALQFGTGFSKQPPAQQSLLSPC